MATTTKRRRTAGHGRKKTGKAGPLPGQGVLVLQGGGALGAYQIGVYEAMHEAGVEPDWVIGTSIGAINAALIAGNAPNKRFERLTEFWARIASAWSEFDLFRFFTGPVNASTHFDTMIQG